MKSKGLKVTLRKKLDDVDNDALTSLLRAYLYCLMAFGPILLLFRGYSGLLIAAVVCIPLAFLIHGITDKISDRWSRIFYGGRKPNWTIQEKYQSYLDQVVFLKRRKQFPQALRKVNEILKLEPEFAEALFLKAQILWEGYQTANGAKRYLDIAKDFVTPKEHLYSWICFYYDSINEIAQGRKITVGNSEGKG